MWFDVAPGDNGIASFKGSGDVYAGSFKKTGKTLISLNRVVYGAILLKAKGMLDLITSNIMII